MTNKWIIQFTAIKGDQTAKVKMGAFGETLDDAISFVLNHCKNQYDSISDLREYNPIQDNFGDE